MRSSTHRKQRGIVLVAVCLFLLTMLAGLGLGVDLNRLLAAQESLRANAEGVALAAVLELDGTPAGFERARNRAGDTWRRQAPAVGGALAVEFGPGPEGPWAADPLGSAELRAVRVTASLLMPLTLLRGVVREESLPVKSVARAAQTEIQRVDSGLLPFAALPDGAFAGGLTVATAKPEDVRLAILQGLRVRVRAGDVLPRHAGAASIARQTLREMVQSDADPVSPSYAEYAAAGTGNGRRVIALPVVDADRRVSGFAAFFLLPAGAYADDAVLRAQPIGGYLEASRRRAQAAIGFWRAEVVR